MEWYLVKHRRDIRSRFS